MKDLMKSIYHNIGSIPNETAIEYGKDKITYGELGLRVNNCAESLNSLGHKGEVYTVMMDRTPDLIVALLAIMKLHKVFVLIDLEYPMGRIQNVLKHSGSKIVLTNKSGETKVSQAIEQLDAKIDMVLLNENKIDDRNTIVSTVINTDSEYKYCYRYYTSGSTGEPKGVIGSYEGLNQFINWQVSEFNIDKTCRVSQLTSPAFDPFLRDVFVPLFAGGTLVIPYNENLLFNSMELLRWLNEKEITIMHIVPSMFKLLFVSEEKSVFSSMEYIFLAGEKLSGRDISKFFMNGNTANLINLYGPTETTLAKFYYRISKDDILKSNIPVGTPISDTQYYVVNELDEECGVNELGEVYIRPSFNMGGYINNLNIDNKFTQYGGLENVFRTGDLGMRLPDGNLELVGRKDQQFKINGIRMEASEIEYEISNLLGGPDVLVDVYENELGLKYVYAFVKTKVEFSFEVLKEHLKTKFSEPFIPVKIFFLDEFYYLPNGKMDRKKMAYIVQEDSQVKQANAVKNLTNENDQLSTELSNIWSQLLFKDNFELTDDFFELGGHSLTAINLIAEIYKKYDIEIPIEYLFDNSTFEGILTYIKQQTIADSQSDIVSNQRKGEFELSSAQKRMFILNLFETVGLTYNSPVLLRLNLSSLNVQRLQQSLEKLVERHEILRTSFHLIEGVPVQKVHDHIKVKIETREVEDDIIKLKDHMYPFNLDDLPLFQVKVLYTPKDVFLFIDFHHIIIDGTSKKLFIKELAEFYEEHHLQELNAQYGDFVDWQNRFFSTEEFKEQRSFWIQTLHDCKFENSIQTDFARETDAGFAGDRLFFEIDRGLLSKLKEIENQEKVTLFMILFAAYNIFLSTLTNDEEVIVGMPVDNRKIHDFKNTLGLITNTLAIKTNIPKSFTYKDVLNHTKRNIILALKNQDYPFEMLVQDLNIKRDPERNPVFNTMFAHQNIDMSLQSDLIIENCNVNYQHSRFDFLLQAFTSSESLYFCFEYRLSLFKKSTIETYAKSYLEILNSITNNVNNLIKLEIEGEFHGQS